MSKIIDLISGLKPGEKYYSYEFFPPKTKSVSGLCRPVCFAVVLMKPRVYRI
jgi:hypothetical protein